MRKAGAYYRPQTIDEIVRLIAQPYVTTMLLSGGAIQLVRASEDIEAVVDVQAIPELARIAPASDGAPRIGAAASLEAVLRDASTPPLLREAIRRSVPWNRRNAISIAEAIEYPDELPEVNGALLALGATLTFLLPEERQISLAALAADSAQPKLPRKGLIARVELPAPMPRQTWGSAHVARTPADIAIVSAWAVLTLDAAGRVAHASLALTGVWSEPARLAVGAAAALAGAALDDASIAAAGRALESEVAPVADYRGSVEYRRAMAPVLLRRALLACRSRLSE